MLATLCPPVTFTVAAAEMPPDPLAPVLWSVGALLGVILVALTFLIWVEQGKLNWTESRHDTAEVASPALLATIDRQVETLATAVFAPEDLAARRAALDHIRPTKRFSRHVEGVPPRIAAEAFAHYLTGIADLERGDEQAIRQVAEALGSDIEAFLADHPDDSRHDKAAVLLEACLRVGQLPAADRAPRLAHHVSAWQQLLGPSTMSVQAVEEAVRATPMVFPTRAVPGFVPYLARQ
ncbi:hypothetical protein ACFPVT_04395 [Corynebacterium choanae]|uniref:Uncharacterized protein n=1 Tax=Corynebacterium choanae TaxID=1862358 RepID=A0A3G6JCQ6_9CORY|nr:hypothetical protein [Corynebacterium choanae]AZA14440.1 hypothetical protein CCHOA_10285 [Corynebacterium choanae]